MLSRSERFQILKTIQKFSEIGCFPFSIHLRTWQLLPHSQTRERQWPSQVYFGSFVMHALYKVATFLWHCFVYKNTPLHELILHGIMALGGAVITYWYHLTFIENAGVFGGYLHMTLTGDIGGNAFVNGRKKTWTERVREFQLQDLFVTNMATIVGAVVPVFIAAGIYYPHLSVLLYAGLPKGFQTWLSFSVLLLEEMRFTVTLCIVAVTLWMPQLISFDLVNTRLKLSIGSIERATTVGEVHDIYSHLRCCQLYVTTINAVQRHIIFSWKLSCIGISIVSGYAAIAHFTEHPVFGILYYVMLINCSTVYTILYAKAFKTPNFFEQAARKALLRLHGRGSRAKNILKRQMLSVPRVGIKVGEFHMMERQSILIFIHYVLSNIVTMLVVYKH